MEISGTKRFIPKGFELPVCMLRHNGHFGIQNNAVLSVFWEFEAMIMDNLWGHFSTVLYINVAVSTKNWEQH